MIIASGLFPNNKGLILCSGYGSVDWQHYPTQFDQDYRFTDVTGDYSEPYPWAIVVGYKTAEPDKHKGIILRGTDTGFEDITSNIPSNFPCRQSPTPFLSVSRYPLSPDKIIVTGGFGTILISTDNGETWAYTTGHPNSDPENRLSDWYYSSDWSKEYYPYPILICGDNSGLLAWSYNDGGDWQTKDFPEPYEITDYGTYDGRLTPLDVQDYACGMSFGYVAVGIPEWEKEQISFDNNNNAQNWWWWHSAACHQYGFPWEITYAQWFVGSDGGILRCDSAKLDYEHCHWEWQPDNDSFYNLNTLGFGVYDDISYYYYYGHALGSKGKKSNGDIQLLASWQC